ncbi:hypothetical protein [Thermocoleostomius sinensis]|uniref:Uncharacterized protein n=1 Tax=Thermocoleostomius sinensis A174 TaxID=2016057 RepID=A0A9E8ZAJ7_9CYAN|nr:hypothetical protein [Thermocoleostomius sinensis]WAL59620.1 hypothetical protein OXH18_20985 [Thermocoleostomius sinensis A174]
MLVASLALHGLVLLVPIPSEPESVAEEEPPEEETIDLASLNALIENPSALPTPTPTPTPEAIVPTPSPVPVPTPAAVIPSPVPVPVPVPVPIPEPTPEITPEPTPEVSPEPTPADLSVTPTPSDVAPGPTQPLPEAFQGLTPEQLQQLRDFLAQREALDASAAGAIGQTARAAQQAEINCALFAEHAPLFFDDCGEATGEPQRKPGIFTIEIILPQRRNQILEYYQETFPNYTFEPIETTYANGEVYAMKLDDNPVLYLNIVSVGLRGSTKIAVFWLNDPTT